MAQFVSFSDIEVDGDNIKVTGKKLINLDHVRVIYKDQNGGSVIEFSNGDRMEMPQFRYGYFEETFVCKEDTQ